VSANTTWLVGALIASVFTAHCDDDTGPPGGGGNTSGSGGSSGSGAGTGPGGGPGDAGAGTSGAAGTSAGANGASGDAGSSAGTNGASGAAGTADAGDGSAGTDGGASNLVGTSGGTVSDATGDITLVIPPGALLGDTQFTFTPVSSMNGLPSEYVFVSGHRVDWTAAGFAAGAQITGRVRVPTTQPLIESDDTLAQRVPIPWCNVFQCPDGSYATNDCGFVDAATLTFTTPVCPASGAGSMTFGLTNTDPANLPTIVTQPASVTVGAGDPAGFSVTASGSAPLGYQWRRDGTNINGATHANLTLDPAKPSDTGAKFSVRVSNRLGSVTSNEVVLTVGPPRTPFWNTVAPQNAFSAGVDLPQVVSLAGGVTDFVVWNEGDILRATSNFATINNLAQPIRGRPQVLGGANLISAFIVFVDNTPTSGCGPFTGNRLSALGVRGGSPLSNRITLYESAGDCIAQFSAGRITTDFATGRPIAFALVEQTAGQLKVGSGGAYWDPAGAGSWVYATGTSSALGTTAACATGPFLIQQGLMGHLQAFGGASGPPTTAVLSWVANENLCAATLTGGTWSSGSVVFDKALGDPAIGPPEAASAIDGAGNALVVASRVQNPAVTPFTFEMTAAFRSAAGGAWQVQALDSSAGMALPSVAFTASGAALVAWRPSLPAAPTSIFAAHRTSAGVWQPTERISSATAADTRFPRICVDSAGTAVAVYQEKSGAADPFQVWARLWSGGLWSAPGRAQNNGNEGRFAECARTENNAFLRSSVFTAWRETDPSDATKFRIVTAQ
jgi:hypothetical protein